MYFTEQGHNLLNWSPTFCLCLQMEMTLEPDPDNEGTKISVRSGHILCCYVYSCDYLPYMNSSIVFHDIFHSPSLKKTDRHVCTFMWMKTVKVQGNDISHKLQISRVGKSDEGLYECRVTRANYGEIVEYKAQAWLRVNSTSRPHRPTIPVKKSSPLHLTDKKPRKPSSGVGHEVMSGDQMAGSTSSSRAPSKSADHIPSSGKRFDFLCKAAFTPVVCLFWSLKCPPTLLPLYW